MEKNIKFRRKRFEVTMQYSARDDITTEKL